MPRLTLVHQLMLASLVVLAAGMLGVGWWIGQQIQRGVMKQTAATTAFYVDSFVASHLQSLAYRTDLLPEQVAHLHNLLRETPLGRHIVTFKVWDAQGVIRYSTDPTWSTWPPGVATKRSPSGSTSVRKPSSTI